MTIDPMLKEIEDRLPELAWKTSLLPHRMTLSTLPKRLFSLPLDSHPSDCVNEIKHDLRRLNGIERFSQEYAYLVKRIEQKIEVLVRLCQIELKKHDNKSTSAQLMMRLCKRRQWVEELEQSIKNFQQQYDHLRAQIKDDCKDTQVQLIMQADLGLLEKKITILKEKLAQTIIS